MKSVKIALALTLAAGFCLLHGSPAEADTAFTIAVPALVKAPSMDGVIDDTWSKAAQEPVLFDFTYQHDGEPTTVYIAQDPTGLDVAFTATQQQAVTENSETNGAGVTSDDNVQVAFWPQGAGGFVYTFMANARGARYQQSSENSSYTPDWIAVAKRTATGYTVTMHIPFDIIRSGGSTSWGVQFERVIQATNSSQVWEHVQGQRNSEDRAYAGTLTGIAGHGAAGKARPKPRLQIYGLGEKTTPANGGNTSRIGADFSLPVTSTSSLLGSFHPDYSNVEVDQQTIAPNAFARYYSEVRPFFTQVSSQYNNSFSCNNCPTLLYTPAIPTFREGYAYEGTQGPLSFAAFDALGYGRSDSAEVLTFNQQNTAQQDSVSLQRVAVDVGGFHDVTSSIFTGYESQKTKNFIYFNGAIDRGSFVTDPSLADYIEYGVGHVDKNTVYGISYQKLGAQFLPLDGFVSQPDVAGIQVFLKKTIYFGSNATLQDISFNSFLNEQNDHHGNPAYKGDNSQINFDFKHELTLHVFGGYIKNETITGQYLPFNQNGLFLGYKTQTTTPSSILVFGGPYYHGSLTAWSYITTLPISRKLKLGLEADENSYAPGGFYASREPFVRQWLERASLDWQFNRYSSFDLGARRITGRNLPDAYQPPDLPTPLACRAPNPYNPFDCVDAGNVSAAFHFLAAHNEWYVVYGNPNDLSTLPAFYVKWIRYIGADKGT